MDDTADGDAVNILLLASHQIAEYDDVRMFAHLGYDVFAPGGYEDPTKPGEGLRPSLPHAPAHPELAALCQTQREKHADEDASFAIDWAKADLHADLIDWADVIIVHHFPIPWVVLQWPRIRHKRVIWRTCGQSDPTLEQTMRRLRPDGLQVVRYSPAERRYFESIGAFAGEDAVIRFGKFTEDYGPWTGEDTVIGNVTQHMVDRGNATGLDFWLAATEGLPARPAGPGSERLPGGIGALGYDEMREYLRRCRAYLYTGTTPASYTLGLMEAMLSGVPTVTIGPNDWAGPDALYEGHEIATIKGNPNDAIYSVPTIRLALKWCLEMPDVAGEISRLQRAKAVEMFSIDAVGPQWIEFLEGKDKRVQRRLGEIRRAA